ncbi:hypothetical protein ACOME3_005373 [Neoechinorhynchus agilis]
MWLRGFYKLRQTKLLISSPTLPLRALSSMAQAKLNADYKRARCIYDFAATDIDGNFVDLEKYRGLRILGFPCNQFGNQEPWPEAEIKAFVKEKGADFDMFSKIEVNGTNAHPLFKYLKSQTGGLMGSFIKWNFTKFLVNKNGNVMKRYGPNVDSKDIEGDVIDLLE